MLRRTPREVLLTARSLRTSQFVAMNHRRHISKITIESKTGIWLLGASRAVLKGILIFYGGALLIGGGLYATAVYQQKDQQPIASDFSLVPTLQARLAVYYQDHVENEAVAETTLIKTLQSIAADEGIGEVDPQNPRQFKLLNLDQLHAHSKEWQGTYLDLVVRLALVKADLGDVENARKLNMYAVNLPMDLGQPELRAQSLRLAARVASLDGDFGEAEKYLIDAVKFNEFTQSDIIFQSQGSFLLDESAKVNDETYRALLDLGVNYTRQERYSDSLEIFLNLLQVATENSNRRDTRLKLQISDIPLLKNYIGEILFVKGLTKESINWCSQAFKEAYIYCRSDSKCAHVTKQSLTNLVALYDKVGDEELKKQAEEQLVKVNVNIVKPSKFDIFSVIF